MAVKPEKRLEQAMPEPVLVLAQVRVYSPSSTWVLRETPMGDSGFLEEPVGISREVRQEVQQLEVSGGS